MITWRLRVGADRRIRAQHPWVFSNELSQSPKGIPPGSPVRLEDVKGNFVASGYGNPHSLIAFRALSFDSSVEDSCELEEIISAVISAWGHRSILGYKRSFRLVYGESDFLPGLVIDRYLVEQNGKLSQVFACQILTAGMQVALHSSVSQVEKFFERIVEEAHFAKLSEFNWSQTSVVIRNDVNIRRLEGLEVEAPRMLKAADGINLSSIDILIDPVAGVDAVKMNCDLVNGQKTGFFLDQAHNINLLCQRILKSNHWEKPVRVLDLCCYVGQWSTQISRAFKTLGIPVEVTAVDVSESALKFAEKNLAREGATALIQKQDVLENLGAIPDGYFDIVIADPPAFIKAKKDVPTGRHAYLKMNTSAFRLVKRGGWVVSCSCSGLLEERDFIETIGKSIRRLDRRARCLVRGGHSADHPNLMSFPEGFYLKMFLHQVAY
jgi:23S rRNA (cytosine1962-C5)-methyltransferase